MPESVHAQFEPLSEYRSYPVEEMRERAEAFRREVSRRRTVRDFSDRPVPRDIIETCLRTAGTAPSGANRQPWHFAVIGPGSLRQRLRDAAEAEEQAFYTSRAGVEWLRALKPLGTDASKPFLETAPWLISVFVERYAVTPDGARRKNYYALESVSIAIGILLVALHHAGLATLTHTPSPMNFLNRLCKRPEHEKPCILVVTGYPAADAQTPVFARQKKSLAEIWSFL